MKTSILLIIFSLCSPYATNNTGIFKEQSRVSEALNRKENEQILNSLADSIKHFIKQTKIAHADIVYRQAVLETGNFKSDIFRNNNNLFGMRGVKALPTTQIGICEKGYGIYESWQMSIFDYAIWQAWSGKRLKRDEYLELLGRIYAADSLYVFKINKF